MLSLHKILTELGRQPTKLRQPRPRPGQLRLKWGKMRYQDPDLIVAGGEGTPRCDRALLMHAFTSETPPTPLHDEWGPSLAEELHRRGYDLRTLDFSIRKKCSR